MQKLFSMLLALMLALLPLGGLAEAIPTSETAAAPTPLPEVGGVVNGFEFKESRDYPVIGAVIYRFEHQRTGAELYYVANDDTNRVFELMFRTQAIDNTGLPHVFEHATLAGSKKYPSKNLWFNLHNGSYNTYMNAFTSTNYTAYPVASLSEAQLLKYADFYTDSCLNPMIMENESIYREEAWRYRLNTPEDPLTLEGTVYSEMREALNLQEESLYNYYRVATPGAYMCNVVGGDPDYIPDMTYEALKAYHEKYYHPSNCVACLYGKLDHYDEFLKLLDDAFAPYKRREFSFEDPDYVPITEDAERDFAYPVEAGSETANASRILYGYLCPGLKEDHEALLQIGALTMLLGDSASALSQAIQEALPGVQWGCGITLESPMPMVVFVCNNSNPEDKQVFRETVDTCLRDLMENPFPQEQLDAIIARIEINNRLTGESDSIGISLLESFGQFYFDFGSPWYMIDFNASMEYIDSWNRDGVFSRLAAQCLSDDAITVLTCTSPAPGEKEKKDAALAEKLQAIKDGMSEDEIAAIVAASNAPTVDNPDTPAMIRDLTAVTVQSLPEEYREYDLSDVTGDDGIRRIDATASVDGIGMPVIMLDIADIPQEDILWFHLFESLIGELDTVAHTHEELDTLWGRYLYGGNIRLSLAREGDGFHPRLRLDWISLDNDLAAGYDLMREIVFDTRFDDTQLIADLVENSVNSMRSSINNDAFSYEVTRSIGSDVSLLRFSSYYNYLDYYSFLQEVADMLESQPEAVSEKLRGIQALVNNSSGAIAAYAGSANSIAVNRPLADAFLASLDSREVVPATYDLPTAADREAVIVDANMQYNGIAAGFDTLGIEYTPELDVVTQLVNDLYLIPQLRTQYGAYGVMHSSLNDFGMYVYSYRDPNVRDTFKVFEAMPEFLENLELDQETLDNYILMIYQDYCLNGGELSGAVLAITNRLEDYPDDLALTYMKALKAMTPEQVKNCAGLYRDFIEKGHRFTTGSASAINGAADLYDDILNPFGTADLSRQELSDVPADSPYYKAVRHVFEEGLMTAREDGSFGVDEPATTGDLAFALNQIISQDPATPDEALAALAGYGILLDTDTADDALSAWDCEDILNSFTAAIGMEYPGQMAGEADPYTRGELANTLAEYFQWLDSLIAEAA